MRNTFFTTLTVFMAFYLAQCASDTEDQNREQEQVDELLNRGEGRDGLLGWHILGEEYQQTDPADFLSFEWDYFMVHNDDGSFTGSLGYLIANPRNSSFSGLEDLVPQGGNIAIAARFDQDDFIAEYRNFGTDGYNASADERRFSASDDADGFWGKMTPVTASDGEQDTIELEGATDNLEWNLSVRQDWPALSSSSDLFVPVRDTEIGSLTIEGVEEQWNVDMLWPRTRVEGSITSLKTDQQYAIKGHGYRENAWGRWAFNLGGWDFETVSDADARVMCAWQSYHSWQANRDVSTALDYLDLAFIESGEIKREHFTADEGEFGWNHPSWSYDSTARQCVPRNTKAVAANGRYRVEVTATIDDHQVPMLSDLTAATEAFVIVIHFPWLQGTITNLETDETIDFEGQGGGEFATARREPDLDPPTDDECEAFGEQFASPFPE